MSGATKDEKRCVEAYLGHPDDGIHWSFIRAAQGSVAGLSVIPLQDVLGLGSDARMNIPSEPGGNWRWRLKAGLLNGEIASKLALLADVSDRLPQPMAVPPVEDFAT
jgi:4-alpha-glucanotransferase